MTAERESRSGFLTKTKGNRQRITVWQSKKNSSIVRRYALSRRFFEVEKSLQVRVEIIFYETEDLLKHIMRGHLVCKKQKKVEELSGEDKNFPSPREMVQNLGVIIGLVVSAMVRNKWNLIDGTSAGMLSGIFGGMVSILFSKFMYKKISPKKQNEGNLSFTTFAYYLALSTVGTTFFSILGGYISKNTGQGCIISIVLFVSFLLQVYLTRKHDE